MKSENDYIAEYIKEKHPSLLGADYAFWKMGKVAADFAVQFAEVIKSTDWSKKLQEYEKIEENKNDTK